MSENTKYRFRFWTRVGQALGGAGMLGAVLMADLTSASPAFLVPLTIVSGALFLLADRWMDVMKEVDQLQKEIEDDCYEYIEENWEDDEWSN